jgi:DNA ligase D
VAKGDDVEVIEVAGRAVRITSPHRVIFPERGETKLDLARYYLAVAEPLLAAMGGRPLLLERYPHGATGKSFFQKRVAPTKADPWLTTTQVETPNGTTANALVAVDLAHVLWAVNMGCLGFHVWPNTAADPGHAVELRIDLDPSPGVTFAMIQEGALVIRDFLAELGMSALPKTTGNRGLHIYVRLLPQWDGYTVRAAAVALARELQRRRGDLLTAAWWKEERGSRVFIDYNQNAPHKTVFGAWCVRANAHGQVSAPFEWDELPAIVPRELNIATVPARLERLGNPWADMPAQSLEPLLDMHERDMAAGLMDAPWPPVYPKMPNEPPRVAPSRARKPVEDSTS